MFALILPDLGDAAVYRPYSYRIPSRLSGSVVVGGRVRVPLGGRTVDGFVLAVTDVPDELDADDPRIRELASVRSPNPAFTPEQAALARWMAEMYLCPLSDALRPCLADPGTLAPKRRWQVADAAGVTTLLPDPALHAVLAYLREHPSGTSADIVRACGPSATAALETLSAEGLVRPMSAQAHRGRRIAAILPALTPDDLAAVAERQRGEQQAMLLRWASEHLLPDSLLTAAEVARLAGVSPSAVKACLEKGFLRQESRSVRRDPWEQVTGRKATPPPLTPAQAAAVQAIVAKLPSPSGRGAGGEGSRLLPSPSGRGAGGEGSRLLPSSSGRGAGGEGSRLLPSPSGRGAGGEGASFLLYGVTGSGKTEVFLHAITQTLALGRQVIVLVPEIALTAQAMALYHGRFPHQVAVLHSHLSAGERFDEWQRIARGEARVVLGARSALFAPCPDVGLIIIDEEHESSYKQESSPRYHAKGVALERGRLCGAPVVLASATPSLETMREAELGRHTLLRLPERIEDRPLPPVQVVDLRRQTPKAQILSHPLREGIAKRLARGEQSILFLNRRGYAHTLLCRACGFQEMCPSCAVTLAFHMGERLLRCHHCDYQRTPDAACPLCKGTRIAYKGVGTERLEEEVHALWPEARIARMDRDTTARKGAHREILDAFAHEEMDILIGTQMVAKGLDFPKVTLVGVIAADTSLGIPDFRAPERTFQLLTQVAGRAGRAEWAGEVVVQTFRPEHYAVQAAALHDYDSFYAQEIRARGDSAACWPPLTGLINIVVSGERETEVKAMAAALARRAAGVPSITLPPVPTHAVLPGLLELIRVDDDTADAPEDDPYDAEALLARAVPSGVTVEGPAPCALARLQNRWRYHVLLRGRDAAALRRVARDLMALDPPPGVHVVVDVEPQGLA